MAHETVLSSYTGVMSQGVIKSKSTSQRSCSVCTASVVPVTVSISHPPHKQLDRFFFPKEARQNDSKVVLKKKTIKDCL